MADKSMKAVIRAEVDPSGVIKGVAATNRELEKLNKKTSAIAVGASFSMAQQGFAILVQGFQMMDRRMSEMTAQASRFSSEAQRGIMRTKMLENQREVFMANTFGLDVAGAERAKRGGIERRALTDVSGGAGQIAFFESLKQDAMSFANDLMASAAQGISDPGEFFKASSFKDRFKRMEGYMPFLNPDLLERQRLGQGQVGVDLTGMGQIGQNMTARYSDNNSRDVRVQNAIIDQENLRLMRQQNKLLKGDS
jgi:hypothetical protein